VGADIAYLKIDDEGNCRASNSEHAIFGIIQDASSKGDPVIYGTLTMLRELVFSNMLVSVGVRY
jgi:GTP-dependent phosphoenolpyruvate carboxykinase